jgi:hypothetical protein
LRERLLYVVEFSGIENVSEDMHVSRCCGTEYVFSMDKPTKSAATAITTTKTPNTLP